MTAECRVHKVGVLRKQKVALMESLLVLGDSCLMEQHADSVDIEIQIAFIYEALERYAEVALKKEDVAHLLHYRVLLHGKILDGCNFLGCEEIVDTRGVAIRSVAAKTSYSSLAGYVIIHIDTLPIVFFLMIII